MEHIDTVYQSDVDADLETSVADFRQVMEQINNLSPAQMADLQLPGSGVGRVYNRRYAITFESKFSASELMQRIQHHPNRFCDPQLAEIEKVDGQFRPMRIGDDFHIAISGPWDGPVRTVFVDGTSFLFVTRKTHIEAGLIRFTVKATGDNQLTFNIESWARSGNVLVWFTYSVIGISKKMQTKMWRYFCLRVAKEAGGDVVGPLKIETRQFSLPEINDVD